MKRRHWLIAMLLWCLSAGAQAELKAFGSDSLRQIRSDRAGQAFVVLLWSLECPPCLQELAGLAEHADRLDARQLVLVCTDGPARRRLAERTLQDFGLQGVESWIYADDYSERLRYQIDPNWFGELPRSYFYDAAHDRTAHSGVLGAQQLQAWLQQNPL